MLMLNRKDGDSIDKKKGHLIQLLIIFNLYFFNSTLFLFNTNRLIFTSEKCTLRWGFPFISVTYWNLHNNIDGYYVSVLGTFANFLLYYFITKIIHLIYKHFKHKCQR